LSPSSASVTALHQRIMKVRIKGFHADNGSEYINHQVAKLLDKLRVEFTQSRPRHSNDNGLAETKNGAVVRKCLGYAHIPALRHRGQCLLHRLSQPLPQLPPPLPVRLDHHQCQGEGAEALPLAAGHDAVQEAGIDPGPSLDDSESPSFRLIPLLELTFCFGL
jgi:transposase InsO family protein